MGITLHIFIVIFIVIFLVIFANVLHPLRAKIIGYWGEKETAQILSSLGDKYKIYNDVLFPCKNGTNQIDHIVVSPYGIFVIETKNYKGWIFGSQYSHKWTQNIYGRKYELYNPIMQNNGHITALKRLIQGYDDKFISIIVFPMQSTLKTNIDIKCNVIKTEELVFRIHAYNEEVISENDIHSICSKIEKFRILDKSSKKSHVQFAKLQSYRNDQLLQNGKCPICGAPLIKRNGKYGSFYGCTAYPKCKFTTNRL